MLQGLGCGHVSLCRCGHEQHRACEQAPPPRMGADDVARPEEARLVCRRWLSALQAPS